LNAGRKSSAAISARGLQLVQAKLEPQLAGLVDDDEQQLVVGARGRMLRGEQAVEIEVRCV
jgi:hypothetical protein